MDDRQSILLEQYILALQADTAAPIPADLDPELGHMAQRLVTYSQVTADTPIKKRVWGAVLSEFEATIQTEEQKSMVISHPIQQKKSSTPLLWVAVLGIIFMLGSAIAIIGNNRPTPPQFGAGVDLSQDATRVIQPTPTMQSTPIPLIEAPLEGYIPVVTFYIPVSWGTTIREDMLTIVYWQADRVPSGSFRWIEDVVGKIATADIPRFMPVLDVFVVDETLAMTGIPNSNPMFGVPTASPIASPTFTPTFYDQNIIVPSPTPDPMFITATAMFENATGTAESMMIQPTPTATHTFTPTPRP